MVAGILDSIKMAEKSYAPGFIFINKGELLDTSVNRSPYAYHSNPMEERLKYKYDVDKEMVLLKFVDASGKGVGMINWFPVHCTSMNNTNTLISSDNKGYAEMLFEQAMDPGSKMGQSSFIAAFAQAHEGDVSPNTAGPRCMDTGELCHANMSTCGGKASKCVAFGPGRDMFESTKIIGHNQFVKAMELYKNAREPLSGPVSFVKQNINMTNQPVQVGDHVNYTCQPAMGYSFAAGTTDGPGAFDFTQGTTQGNSFWRLISSWLKEPSAEQVACHQPKPILVDSGEMASPYEWQPKVVETQMLRIGKLVLAALPAEFTTMSGRRLMNSIREELKDLAPDEDFEVMIAGLSNAYSDYVTTFEEYQVQRYEGASTIYGPYTLKAYIQQYRNLTKSLIKDESVTSGPEIKNMRSKLYALMPKVYWDTSGTFNSYGDIYNEQDADDTYHKGDSVKVSFISANPRNSWRIRTFLSVERRSESGSWEEIHTDADWCTKFEWGRSRWAAVSTSEATITWTIPPTTRPGTYRIRHFGHSKSVFTTIYPFTGTSKSFQVLP